MPGILYFLSMFKAVQYDSRVLHILMGTEDMTHGCYISSRVLRIWLTGTDDMTHGYRWYDSRVLHILTGTEDMTHGYCMPSRVLHIVYTGWYLPKRSTRRSKTNSYKILHTKMLRSKKHPCKPLWAILSNFVNTVTKLRLHNFRLWLEW